MDAVIKTIERHVGLLKAMLGGRGLILRASAIRPSG
jgi:hypothetical protein